MYEIGNGYDFVGEDDEEYDGDNWEYEDDEWDEGDEEDELAALLGARAPRRRVSRGRARGAARPAARRGVPRGALMRRAGAIAQAVKRVESGSLLKKVAPTKSREFPIGFDSVANIAAAATATLTQRPQVVFRPERIVVPAAVAAFFQISDVRVGKNSQLVSAGALPAATFAETAFGVRLKMDTCQISMDLILVVINIDVAAHRFLASMIGESVE